MKETIDTKFARVPPNAKSIEEMIIGALMIDSTILPVVMNKLYPEAFYVTVHEIIFRAIATLYSLNRNVDIETVVYQLRSTNELETVGGILSLSQLTNKVVSSAHTEDHINIILQLHLKREAIRIANEMLVDGFDDTVDAFETVEKGGNSLIKAQERLMVGVSKNMEYYVAKVAENRDKIASTGNIGLPTGFTELDKVIGGWVSPDFIVVAARPGMGKTALIISTAHTLSVKNKIPGAIFSLEMSGEQLTERLESVDSNIFHEKLRKATLSDADWEVLLESEMRISQAPLYIEDKPAISIREFRTKAILLKRKFGIKYIILDYLQLMRSVDSRITSREQIISDISRGCKEVAKELEIPVIALSQLSRAVEARADKMPQLSDLRESGSIEQDADEVVFLMRPEYYNMIEPVEIGGKEYDTKGLVIVKVDKNRHGATQNIALRFQPELMKYSDYEKELYTPTKFSYQTINEEAPF